MLTLEFLIPCLVAHAIQIIGVVVQIRCQRKGDYDGQRTGALIAMLGVVFALAVALPVLIL